MYSLDVTYTGAAISIVDPTKCGGSVVGFRVVPLLASGESARLAYEPLQVTYVKQTTRVTPAENRVVSVNGPDWCAAFGGSHQITAGKNGQAYRVWIAEECKELEFVTSPELYGFGGSAPAARALSSWATGYTGSQTAAAGAYPTLSTDGADLSGKGAWRVELITSGGATLTGAGTVEAFLYDAVNSIWTRAADFDVAALPVTSASVPHAQFAPVGINSPAANMGRVYYRANAVGLSAGTTVTVNVHTKDAV